jgi:hypothetical protein
MAMRSLFICGHASPLVIQLRNEQCSMYVSVKVVGTIKGHITTDHKQALQHITVLLKVASFGVVTHPCRKQGDQ